MADKKKAIGFNDLTLTLKVAIIGGVLYAVVFTISFVYGMVSAFIGAGV